MGQYLNPDNLGFASAVNSQIYVDKTGMLDYLNQVIGTEQRYVCVSRPRRFRSEEHTSELQSQR